MVIALSTIVLVIVVVGVLLYLANRFLPMEGNLKDILNWVVVGAVVVWLVRALGLWQWLQHVQF